MLDTSPQNLRLEVDAAISLRKKHTDVSAKLIKRFAGLNYREDWSGDDSGNNHDAHEFEYQVNMVPSLIHTNPAVEVKGLLPGIDDEAKEALECAYPQWIESVNFAELMQPIAYDIGFDFGVVQTGVAVLPGHENDPEPKPLWPMIWRVSPRRFFMDPQANTFQTARFMGHSWVRDKDDLKAETGPDGQPVYDPAAVDSMVEDADLEAARATVQKDPSSLAVARKQVTGYEVWCRDDNMIYTIGSAKQGGQQDLYLRPPRPFTGCRDTGPYTLFGVFVVPDQLYPLPALAVTSSLVEEINRHRGQASDDAGNAKKLVFVDSQAKQAKAACVNGKSGTVWTVPGLATGGVKEIEIGGPAKENIEYIRYLQDLLDRQSGLTEIIRGNITGATATETDLAQQSADVRARYARGRFREGVIAIFKAVGHFFIFNDQVVFWGSETDPVTGQKVAVQFTGGLIETPHPGFARDPQSGQLVPVIHPPQDPSSYQRLIIGIEPYSMEMVDQGVLQRRIMGMAEFLGTYGPLMPQTPQVDWANVIDDLGEANNMKDASKRYLRPQVLQGQQMGIVQSQQMAMAGQAQQLQGGPPGEPGAMAGGAGGGSKQHGPGRQMPQQPPQRNGGASPFDRAKALGRSQP